MQCYREGENQFEFVLLIGRSHVTGYRKGSIPALHETAPTVCSCTSVVRKATFAVNPVTFGDCKCFPVSLLQKMWIVEGGQNFIFYQRVCTTNNMDGSDRDLLINADDKRQGVPNLDILCHQSLWSLPVEDPHAGGRHGRCGSQGGRAQATGGERFNVWWLLEVLLFSDN